MRHADRIAIESQPAATWATRLESETDPQTIITASVALARTGESTNQPLIVKALQSLDFGSLTESQQLGALQAYALTFIRLGEPDENQRPTLIAKLNPYFPGDSPNLNTELIRVLTYLQSPTVVAKTIKLIKERGAPEVPDWTEIAARNPRYGKRVKDFMENAPPSREVYYALMISNARAGWTLEARRSCLELLNVAANG